MIIYFNHSQPQIRCILTLFTTAALMYCMYLHAYKVFVCFGCILKNCYGTY